MLITLLTDFGEGSPYVAQMKGVILGINPQAQIVDLTHSIPPQQIDQAARALAQVVGAFPAETCHIGVVDPGVGTERRILLWRINAQYFIAPDNGLISLVADQNTPAWVYSLCQAHYWRSPVSATFHGRDIMAPVAAHLSLGVAPTEFGEPVDDFVSLQWHPPQVGEDRVLGTVASIDTFGNVITDIERPLLARIPAARVRCRVGETDIHALVTTYGQAPQGTLVALFGSGGYLEFAVVNGNANQRLGVRPGDRVSVEW